MNTISKINKVCAVIPFYNERNSIKSIIINTLPFVDSLILIDDGSTDGSSELIPQNDNIYMLKHETNLGKGAALKNGLTESYIKGNDITITLDADLQHPPESIPEFIKALNSFDIVIGNRLGNLKKMPIQRIASNKLTSFLLSIKTGTKLLDTQCGYRAFRNNVLKDILPVFSGYEAESEMLIKAARKNFRIGFTEIPTVYGDEKSKLKAVKTIIGFIRVMFI